MSKEYSNNELQNMTVEELQQINSDFMDLQQKLIEDIQELQNVTVEKPQIAKNQLQQSNRRTKPKPTLTAGQQPTPLIRGERTDSSCNPGQLQHTGDLTQCGLEGFWVSAEDQAAWFCDYFCGGTPDLQGGIEEHAWGGCSENPDGGTECDYGCHYDVYCMCDGVTCNDGWCVETSYDCPIGSCNDYYQIFDGVTWDELGDVIQFFNGYCGVGGATPSFFGCLDGFFNGYARCLIQDFDFNSILQEYAEGESAWYPISGVDAYVLYDESVGMFGIDSIDIDDVTIEFDYGDGNIETPIYLNVAISVLTANTVLYVDALDFSYYGGYIGTAPSSNFNMQLMFEPVFSGGGTLEYYTVSVGDMTALGFQNFYADIAPSLEGQCDCGFFDVICWLECVFYELPMGTFDFLVSAVIDYIPGAIAMNIMGAPLPFIVPIANPLAFMASIDAGTCFTGLGDMNYDFTWNVLDIVKLANCILAQNCSTVPNGQCGDANHDGAYNVLDVVIMANCVLAQNCSDCWNDGGIQTDYDYEGNPC